MSFETERCRHGMLYTEPCPECVLYALEAVERAKQEAVEEQEPRDSPAAGADE